MLKTNNAGMEQPVSSHLKEASQNNRLWTIYLPHILIMIVITVGILLRLSDYPISWFDEGYTTHVAHLLVEKGVYGTYNGLRFSPFDPFVSSGPGVVLPIAIIFKLFEGGVTQGRLALLPYSLLLGLTLFYLARYLYGQTMAFFTVIGMLVVFQWLANLIGLDLSTLMLGRQVLGEVPAISMILLGLLIWFKSWDRNRWVLSILAGVICGIGMLSKMQTAFGLLPALFMIAAFRTFKSPRHVIVYFAPLCIIFLIVVSWLGFQRLSTPPELRAEYSNITSLAIMVHYVIGLFGRVLERRVVLISVTIGLFIFLRFVVFVRQSRKEVEITNRRWAEMTIIAFALFYLIWCFDLSVGWERYLFPAFILACLLAAKLIWDVVIRLFGKSENNGIKRLRRGNINLYMIGASAVSVLLIAMSILDLAWGDPNVASAQHITDYIRANIPQEAMIESWEWELDAPSHHLNIHHPDSTYVIRSIWDLAMDQPLVLDYDMLQANPDYLILGRFNNLTHIYAPDEINKHFELIESFGLYHIYKRK